MYKRIALFFSFLFLITGCGAKKKELSFDQISDRLQTLMNEDLDYQAMPTLLKDIDEYDIYNENEILEQTGLDETMYESIFFCKAKESVESILVVQPKKESVRDLLQSYWDERVATAGSESDQQLLKNRVEQEYGNHFIYIVGKNSDEQLEQIKDLKQNIFPNMISMKKEDLKKIVGLEVEKIEGYVFSKSNKLDQVYQYLIVKVDKKEESNIKQTIHNYFESLEDEWENKDLEQYQLLKKRMEKTMDSYLIYLVSKDNEAALQVIQEQYQ